MKKQIMAAAAVFTAAITSICANAQSNGFSDSNTLVVMGKTPYDTKYTQVAWNTDTSDAAGVPTATNSGVLFPAGNTVTMLSEKDGSAAGTVELSEKTAKNCKGAIVGNTYVQPTKTGVSVINTKTMTLIAEKSLGGEVITNAAIKDSCVYIAAKTESGYTLYCLDMEKGLEAVWEYSTEKEITELSLQGNFVVFCDGQSLVCCDAENGTPIENALNFETTNAPFCDEYAVYLSAEDGCVYKLRLTEDGTIEPDTLTACEVGEGLTRPVVYEGRVYVGAKDGFYLLDSLNMEVVYCLDEIKSSCAPIVCVGNGTRVYTVAPLENYYCLYSIYDMSEDDEPTASKLAKLEDFSSGSFTAAQSGTMYFCDAVGRVYALSVAEYSIVLIIIKLVLLLGVFVLIILILRQWVKQRAAKRPPQY